MEIQKYAINPFHVRRARLDPENEKDILITYTDGAEQVIEFGSEEEALSELGAIENVFERMLPRSCV